jgi:Mycobacterium membrane protein
MHPRPSSEPQPEGTPNPSYTPGAAPIPQPPIQPPIQPPTTEFPPINYAPPGYQPDYGPGWQYPPSPYAPPPRRSNAPLIAVVIAVALLLCGGVSTAGILIVHNVKARAHEAVKPLTDPTLPDLPDGGLPTDTGKQIQVTYEVTGDGPAEVIYLPKLGASPTRDDDVKLPWRFTVTMETPALISVIAMRAGSDDGSITCRALVDGREVKKTTSGENGFATAACTYFALH